MIKINLSAPVLDLALQPIMEVDQDNKPTSKETSLARVLANQLVSSQKGDAIKYLDWAISLFGTGEITVDDSDFTTIRTFVSELQTLNNLVKGQLIRKLDEQKKQA